MKEGEIGKVVGGRTIQNGDVCESEDVALEVGGELAAEGVDRAEGEVGVLERVGSEVFDGDAVEEIETLVHTVDVAVEKHKGSVTGGFEAKNLGR
ncbi:MAG TPA: hypothetical protein VGH73_03850 [Thermoanaerobaculia bacterium]